MQENSPPISLVRLAVLSESALLCLALVWAYLSGLPIYADFDFRLIMLGVFYTLLLLLFGSLFRKFCFKTQAFAKLLEFERRILIPACQNLTAKDCLAIALCSGVAEEIFFRGVLDTFLSYHLGVIPGLTLSAAIFALIHFGTMALYYLPVVLLYFAFALFFSILYLSYNNLIICILIHGLYNYFALGFYSKMSKGKHPSSNITV